MGRITNSLGLRLGQVIPWKYKSYGKLTFFNLNNFKFEDYVKNLAHFGELVSLGFLVNRVIICSEKKVISVELYDSYFVEDNPIYNYFLELRLVMFERSILLALKLFYKDTNYESNLVLLSVDSISAEMIVSFIRIKFMQRSTFGQIIMLIRTLLLSMKKLEGVRLDFSGRYTRRQRASHRSIRLGRVPFSSLENVIDYAEGSVILKYGKCGFKIWLNKVN